MKVPFLHLRTAHDELPDALDAAYGRVMVSGRDILVKELKAFESAFATCCAVHYCPSRGNSLGTEPPRPPLDTNGPVRT
ncbi:hypothetical protein EDC27_2982 [Desulfosoma caldarium]|uniref:Uncharacterized protein n=1 Tax=Desulfosoma caldarium TaxID=610254 RepID=A0A3N1US01_9BACT|nr:hypothetical protein EDC27_2982 [Desulfosoma caldarium]